MTANNMNDFHNPYQPPQTQLSTKKRKSGLKWRWLLYAVFFDVFALTVYALEGMKGDLNDFNVVDWLEFPFLVLLCTVCIAWSLDRKIFRQRFWKIMLWIVGAHAVYSTWDFGWAESSLEDAVYIAALMTIFYVPHSVLIWKYAYGKNNLWMRVPREQKC